MLLDFSLAFMGALHSFATSLSFFRLSVLSRLPSLLSCPSFYVWSLNKHSFAVFNISSLNFGESSNEFSSSQMNSPSELFIYLLFNIALLTCICHLSCFLKFNLFSGDICRYFRSIIFFMLLNVPAFNS